MTDMEMIFMGTPRQTDHSPTPWELVEATEHHGPYICNVYGGDVCDLYAMSNPLMPSTASGGISRPVSFVDADANAAFIVKAVNNHDALVARVKYLEATEANEILRLKTALKECAMRCRYDGDLFHDQGNIQRRDASWKAQEDAEAILASVSPPQGGGK